MSRMDDLIAGKNYEILCFRDLPTTHQLALVRLRAVDGDAWEIFYDDSGVFDNSALIAALPDYVREYGDGLWGSVTLTSDCVKKAVMADEDIESSFSCWEDYAAWYNKAGDVPHHSNENRWPVILSSDDYETVFDGWHRLHCYMRDGHTDIPAIFLPDEQHIRVS